MKKDNILADKSFKFAVKIVDLYNHLREEKKDYILSKQVVRCGTSIGANVEEAIGGLSEKDFVAKLGIAYKESRETIYWLRLLHATGIITAEMFEDIVPEAEDFKFISKNTLQKYGNYFKNTNYLLNIFN